MAESSPKWPRLVIKLAKGQAEEFRKPPTPGATHAGERLDFHFKMAIAAESLWAKPVGGYFEAIDVETADGVFLHTFMGDPRPFKAVPPRLAYCAVRKSDDDGHEWLDVKNTLGGEPTDVERQDRNLAQQIPGYVKANPMVRIAKVLITEVEE